MAGEATGTAALPPEIQEKLTRLEKLERDNATLGYRLRHWEGFGKQFENVQYDANGLPIGVQEGGGTPATQPAAQPTAFVNGHPLAPLGVGIEGWNPQMADQYYLQLIGQKGYLTREEAEKLAEAKAQTYANTVMGNARVWRMVDKLLAQTDYKDLGNMNSELAKRTTRILQERQYGQPMSEQSKGFDDWGYRELGDLQYAADVARMELDKEVKAATTSAAAAQTAQAATELSPATPGAGAVPTSGKPDFASMQTTEEVLNALDQATTATVGPGG